MKKWIWVYLLCVLVVLMGYVDAADEELSYYINKVREDLESESEVDAQIVVFGDLIMDGKPEDALQVLQDNIIPEYEALIKEYEGIVLEGEDAIATNEIIIGLHQVDLDTQLIIEELFTQILEKVPQDRADEVDIYPKLERLYEINEAYAMLRQEYFD